MQAKDIPDDVFIAAVATASKQAAERWGQPTAWAMRWDVEAELNRVFDKEVPWKVVIAKAAKMIKQKRMDGCACGCRGDFDLRGFPGDPFAMPPHSSDGGQADG